MTHELRRGFNVREPQHCAGVWFLVRFTGTDADIDLEAHDPPEFCEWKWVEPELLPDLIVPFKRTVYRTIVETFRGKF